MTGARTKRNGNLGTAHSRSWLTPILLSVLFLAVPAATLFYFYQASRVEQATIRNFRALATAADRVDKVVQNLRNVTKNTYFGLVEDGLWKVKDRLSNHDFKENPRFEDVYDILASFLSNREGRKELWTSLHDVLKDRNDTLRTVGDSDTRVTHVPRKITQDQVEKLCGWPTNDPYHRCEELLEPQLIKDDTGNNKRDMGCSGLTKRFVSTNRGTNLEIEDCRSFAIRSEQLYKDLLNYQKSQCVDKKDADKIKKCDATQVTKDLTLALDLFGVRSRTPLSTVVSEATRHLRPFFDNYMLVDGSNLQVVYQSEGDNKLGLGGRHSIHRETTPFVGLIDLEFLESSQRLGPGEESNAPLALGPYGLSSVSTVEVGDVPLRVFLHPFTLHGIEPLHSDKGAAVLPVYYMVGVVQEGQLRKEAMTVRRAHSDRAAMLMIAVVFLLPVIWLMTAGDRLTLGAYRLVVVVGCCLFVLLFLTVLALHMRTTLRDEAHLDNLLNTIADAVRDEFSKELDKKLTNLIHIASQLKKPDPTEKPYPAKENPLMPWVYCGFEGTNDCLPAPSGEIVLSRLDQKGQQVACYTTRRLRTPRLDLEFREYFRKSRDGNTWQFRPKTVPSGCETSSAQSSNSVPYYIERIDSINEGIQESVISVPIAKVPIAKPDVAVAIADFAVLERTIFPPDMGMAVIDRATGRTLYHTQGERVMVANFFEDVDRDPEVLSTVRSDGGPVRFNYNGVPHVAHIAPLGVGTPWTLVVFRTHAVGDRVTSIAASMTIAPLTFAYLAFGFLFWATRLICGPHYIRRVVSYCSTWNGVSLGVIALVTTLALWSIMGWVYLGLLAAISVAISFYTPPESFDALDQSTFTEPKRWSICLMSAAMLVLLAVAPAKPLMDYNLSHIAGAAHGYLNDALEQRRKDVSDELKQTRLRYHPQGQNTNFRTDGSFRFQTQNGNPSKASDSWAFASFARWLLAYSATSFDILAKRPTNGNGNNVDVAYYANAVWKFWSPKKTKTGDGCDPSVCEQADTARFLGLCLAVFLVAGLLICVLWGISGVLASNRTGSGRLAKWELTDEFHKQASKKLVLLVTSHSSAVATCDAISKGFGAVHKAVRSSTGRWRWDQARQSAQPPHSLYLIEQLDLSSSVEADGLLELLEAAISKSAWVVLCTDTVPSYELEEFKLESLSLTGTLDDHTSERIVRWTALLSQFETYDAKDTPKTKKWNFPVLEHEAKANSDLFDAAYVIDKDDKWRGREPSRSLNDELVGALCANGEAYYARLWSRSMLDEQLQLYALSRYGFANATQQAALSNLTKRGLISWQGELPALRSEAFGQYISSLTHHKLFAWRRQGQRNNWRTIWPFIATLAILAFIFIIRTSSQETIGLLLAAATALAGIAPLYNALFRGPGSTLQPTGGMRERIAGNRLVTASSLVRANPKICVLARF